MKEKGTWSEKIKLQEGFLSKSHCHLHLGSQRPLVGSLHYSLQHCREATWKHMSPQRGHPTLWLRFPQKISNWFSVEAASILSPSSNMTEKLRIATQLRTRNHHTWCRCHSEQPAWTCTPLLDKALSTCSASGSQRSTVWNHCFFFPKRKVKQCT